MLLRLRATPRFLLKASIWSSLLASSSRRIGMIRLFPCQNLPWDMIWRRKILSFCAERFPKNSKPREEAQTPQSFNPSILHPFLRGREDFNFHFKMFSIHFIIFIDSTSYIEVLCSPKRCPRPRPERASPEITDEGMGRHGDTRRIYNLPPVTPPSRQS